MKRIILLILSISYLIQNAGAQTNDGKLEFGFGIIPCISWVNPSTKMVSAGSAKTSFGFGARIYKHLSDKYAFGAEINIQNIVANTQFNSIGVKHSSFSGTKTSSDFNVDYQLRYLDIPLMLKMNTSPDKSLSFYGEFGGSIGFLLHQVADITSKELNLDQVNTSTPEDGDRFTLSNPSDSNYTYDIKISTVKAGLIFGGGIQYSLTNNSNFEVGLRYNLGLSDIYRETKWKGTCSSVALNIAFIF